MPRAHSFWCLLFPPEEQSTPPPPALVQSQARPLSCPAPAQLVVSSQPRVSLGTLSSSWPLSLGPLLAPPCGGHPGAVSRVCTSERGVPKALWADEGPRRSLQVLRSSPRLSCLAEAPSLVILAHSSLLSSGLSSFLTHLLPLLPLPQLPAVGLASCGQKEVVGAPGTSRDSRKWEPPTFD